MVEKIVILDFGSQFTQIIGRRLRELNVYCEIHPFNKVPALDASVKGVILSGSPFSVRDPQAPQVDLSRIKGKMPLLAVCYGAQYIAHHFGGEVNASSTREYGRAILTVEERTCPLFEGIPATSQVWMSHGDSINKLPAGAKLIASTHDVKYAAYRIEGEETYAFQYHPEVFHSERGGEMLRNFVYGICGCKGDWTADSFIESTVAELRAQLGDDRVILGLSGGVDSTVAAVLLNKAIGKNLYCIFVDNGLLRKNEFEGVLDSYKHMGLNVIGVNATEDFLAELAGVSDPEGKRKAIGKVFIDVFDREAHKIENARWLAQGTIYPDVIESCSVNGPSATIKSHHNVGGLPERMKLKIVEPLRALFKDEVRRVGIALGIKRELIARHPFPGPGLGIRILGEVTREKLEILKNADEIYINSLRSYMTTLPPAANGFSALANAAAASGTAGTAGGVSGSAAGDAAGTAAGSAAGAVSGSAAGDAAGTAGGVSGTAAGDAAGTAGARIPNGTAPEDTAHRIALYDAIWQAGTILLPIKSVGVMGDERTYEYTIALRAVTSNDGMTADWVHLPYDFLAKVSNDIINKVRGVNRVVYDISSKPPATIEWE